MDSPRDRDGFDDRADDGSGWREPAHLGEGAPGGDDRAPADPVEEASPERGWQPPGWDLPASGPRGEPAGPPAQGQPVPRSTGDTALGGGLFRRRPRAPGDAEKVFAYEGDNLGAQNWALQQGWTISDGSGPEDASLRVLIDSAPVRLTKDDRAASVLRGRAGNLEMVAFDVVYADGRRLVPRYAITAVPMLGTVSGFRLSPARLWRHRTAGLAPLPSGNQAFDVRWLLLAGEDGPQVRRLVQDPAVQGLLLGTDDGDEFWSAGGYVAAIRPDGHRPLLIEHHARLLTAIVAGLAAGY